jgi:hypothetical protein
MDLSPELAEEFANYVRERVIVYKETTVDGGTHLRNFLESKKGPKKMSREDLSKYKHNMCVGQLIDFIEDHKISMDAKILVQRIEDAYYERRNWPVYEKKTSDGTSQYHPVWWAVDYTNEDRGLLFIDLHY